MTLSQSKFFNEGFATPYRLDRTAKVDGTFFYLRENIPSTYLKKITVNELFERFYVVLNLRSKKLHLGCSYTLHKDKITCHLAIQALILTNSVWIMKI